MAKLTAPRNDEFELSLFGPGIGECIAVHLGCGEWVVVDSCLNESRDAPVALEYLEAINVDIGSDVKLIVVSHWHDDHIAGIADLLDRAASAAFACSAALHSEEFMTMILSDEQIKLVQHRSGLSEFVDVFQILRQRRGGWGPDIWASDAKRLYSGANGKSEVISLSPSAQTITDAIGNLARGIPTPGSPQGRKFISVDPNEASVALWVRIGNHQLLLGGDLEASADERRGWRAIIASAQPPDESHAYKIAHHGAPNADLPEIWDALVIENGIAVVTPYARGRKHRPAPEDVDRIRGNTDRAYCTKRRPTRKPPHRGAADKTMNEVAKNRRAMHRTPGHIRLRAPTDGNFSDVQVELFDGAVKL